MSSEEKSRALDLGVIGRGQNLDKTGRLNKCDPAKKGCISTFDDPADESYIPPWTYQPGFSTQAVSANDARRQALREQANIEANGGVAPPPKPQKSKEEAYAELKAAIKAKREQAARLLAEADALEGPVPAQQVAEEQPAYAWM